MDKGLPLELVRYQAFLGFYWDSENKVPAMQVEDYIKCPKCGDVKWKPHKIKRFEKDGGALKYMEFCDCCGQKIDFDADFIITKVPVNFKEGEI